MSLLELLLGCNYIMLHYEIPMLSPEFGAKRALRQLAAFLVKHMHRCRISENFTALRG